MNIEQLFEKIVKMLVGRFVIEVIGSTHKDMSSISVYPNPATEKTMFAFFAHNAAKTIREVFDMTGSRVADVFVGTVEAGIR